MLRCTRGGNHTGGKDNETARYASSGYPPPPGDGKASMEQHGTIDRRILEKYLSHHLLGSQSGLAHFNSARQTWEATPHEHAFASLYEQVRDDQNDLRAIIGRLRLQERPLAKLMAPVASFLGRINPINPLRMRRLSSTQVQLDVLIGLLNAKLSMWNTLLAMAASESKLDPVQLMDLADRAQSQITQMKKINMQTWPERFAGKS